MEVNYFAIEPDAMNVYGFMVFGDLPDKLVQTFSAEITALPQPPRPTDVVAYLKRFRQTVVAEGYTCGEVDCASHAEWQTRLNLLPTTLH